MILAPPGLPARTEPLAPLDLLALLALLAPPDLLVPLALPGRTVPEPSFPLHPAFQSR